MPTAAGQRSLARASGPLRNLPTVAAKSSGRAFFVRMTGSEDSLPLPTLKTHLRTDRRHKAAGSTHKQTRERCPPGEGQLGPAFCSGTFKFSAAIRVRTRSASSTPAAPWHPARGDLPSTAGATKMKSHTKPALRAMPAAQEPSPVTVQQRSGQRHSGAKLDSGRKYAQERGRGSNL